MKRVPRAAGVVVWTVGAVALHAVVPFELSRLGDRVTPQGPAMSARRGAGLLTVVAGAALMAWAMTAHYQAAPRGWALFYRRPAVWAGLAVQWAAFAAIARWEERRLLTRFGDDYSEYLEQVPRWVPRRRTACRGFGQRRA